MSVSLNTMIVMGVAIEKEEGFEVWCNNELLCTKEPLESVTTWAQNTPRVDVTVIFEGMELGAVQTWLAGGPSPHSELSWLEQEKRCQQVLLST
jgi:hypothetical protein